MAYAGTLVFLVFALGAFLYWRGRLASTRWFLWLGVLTIPLPYVAALAGWVLSEVGRQPWIVWGLLKTADANSPSVSTATIATSLGVFVVLYVALLIVDFVLMRRYARVDPPEVGGEGDEFALPAVDLLMDLETFWFCLDRGRLGDVLPARGVRLRRRDAAPVRPALGRGAEHGSADDRAGLGRERGLARRGRWCDVRGVPGLVRDDVLGLLPRAPAHPLLPHRPRRLVRVALEERDASAGARRGRGRTRSAASAPRSSGGSGCRALLYGVPIDSDGDFAGSFWDLFSPYTVFAGLAVVLLFAFHGATFLTLRTAGELRDRSGQAARRLSIPAALAAAAFLVWTVAVAMDRNDKDLFPPVLPAIVGIAALALAVVFVFTGRTGRAFAMTALGAIAAVATLVHEPLPAGDGLELRLREQPHGRRRSVVALRAQRDDGRGRDLRAARPPLPGVDVLRVPGAPRRRAGRHAASRSSLPSPEDLARDSARRRPRRRLRRHRRR